MKREDALFKYQIDQLWQWILDSKSTVFFGGAGVSTESGIPDFRSKDGLYNQHDVKFDKYDPEYLLSKTCLDREPGVFYEYYRQKLDMRHCEPNITHKTLAEMEQRGMLSSIVTQNIDGLHQKAGSKIVYEIHGTLNKNYCYLCKQEYDADYIFNSEEKIPHCPECNSGIIRPDVVLYDEMLPRKVTSKAIKDISCADLLIVAGTSLKVYPAANYIHYFRGEHLVVLNNEPVDLIFKNDDLFIHCSIGQVFEDIGQRLHTLEVK